MSTAPDLNTAAHSLIEALENVQRMHVFRDGLRKQTEFWSVFANPGDPSHHDALDLLAVWRALDDLAAAVAARKAG